MTDSSDKDYEGRLTRLQEKFDELRKDLYNVREKFNNNKLANTRSHEHTLGTLKIFFEVFKNLSTRIDHLESSTKK